MSSLNFLIRILLILFVIDVVKKIFFKPKENKQLKNITEPKKISNQNEIQFESDEDEFSSEQIRENTKTELIIKYDKYTHEKDFILLKNKIEKEFNKIKVKGEEFPLPLNRKYFINFTYITQIGTCLLLFFPKYLKIALPFLSNNAIEFVEKYNLVLIFGNFLAHFILNKHISRTGAFEIMLNDKKIYSKLEMQTLPDINNLNNILKKISKLK